MASSSQSLISISARLKRATTTVLTVVLVAVALIGCGGSQPTSENTGSIAPTPSVAKVRSEFASIIEGSTPNEKSRDVLALLRMAAVEEGLVRNLETADTFFVEQFADDDLGLFVFEHILDAEKNKDSQEEVIAICDSVLSRNRDSAVGGMALHEKLNQLRLLSSDRFLTEIDRIEERNQSGREFRIALLQRMEYFGEINECKSAALDALRFWATFPDHVEKSRLRLRLIGNLSCAGYSLESSLLENSSEPGGMARRILEDLTITATNSSHGPLDGLESSLSALYASHSPALDQLLETRGSVHATSFDQAVFLARCTQLASDANESIAPELCEEYLVLLKSLVETEALNPTDLDFFISISNALINSLASYEKRASVFGDKFSSSQKHEVERALAATEGLVEICLMLLWYPPVSESISSSEVTIRAENAASFFIGKQYYRAASQVYEQFATRYPESESSAPFLLRLADIQKQDLRTPREAIETYQEVIAEYPDSEQAQVAFLKAGMTAIDVQDFEKAYTIFQACLSRYQSTNAVVPLALYGSALCENALGAPSDAASSMENLIKSHPNSTAAPKALLWLGNSLLAAQEYKEANARFVELCEKYPGSEEAIKAKGYVTKLESMDSHSEAD